MNHKVDGGGKCLCVYSLLCFTSLPMNRTVQDSSSVALGECSWKHHNNIFTPRLQTGGPVLTRPTGVWRLIYLFLLVLRVVVAHNGFGSAAAAPPAACLPSLAAFVLPSQANLHFHGASWGRTRRGL